MTRLRLVSIRSEYDAKIIVSLNLTVVRYSQGMGNALRTLQMLPIALPIACECLRVLTANDTIRNIR